VIDVALRSRAFAMDSSEAVAGGVFEKGRVGIGHVIRTGLGSVVISETRVDAGLREAVDVRGRRRGKRDLDAPCDRMLVVGLGEREVAPDREARMREIGR
jgi:hypothetical protein